MEPTSFPLSTSSLHALAILILFFTINGGISFHYKTCCTLDKSNALSCAFETSSPIMSKLEIKGSVIYIAWCGLYFEPPVDKKLA